jgi:hypothetical protein
MSRENTFDTIIMTWRDNRTGGTRTFDTAWWADNIIITGINNLDDWTISRSVIGDPETARQVEVSHAWGEIAFEITGVIVDPTKEADKTLREWAKTAGVVHMRVVGFENLERDFYITAFKCDRYGNPRDFKISCMDVNGHVKAQLVKSYPMVQTQGMFKFPFSNPVGSKFAYGSISFMPDVVVHSDSFIETEPFTFIAIFSGVAQTFSLMNDQNQSFTINYSFQAGDRLMIDLVNSEFALTRAGTRIPILQYIDYANSQIFGIRQGDQVISVPDIPLAYAQIVFTEHRQC